jgi:hypothetical protein
MIDYSSGRRVILSVDSSFIATGFILLQIGEDGKEYLYRFGSITWNERESRYSQAKIELYGLFRALRAYRVFLVGAKDLLVRMDAKYIKGMLNNPDIQPNATMNRWIAAIMLFNFKLEHTPGATHAPDGLSRRPATPEDPVDDEDIDDWIDRACGFAIVGINWGQKSIARPRSTTYLDTFNPYERTTSSGLDTEEVFVFSNTATAITITIPRTDKAKEADEDIL